MNKNKILVPLSDNSYEVTIKQGLINNVGEELNQIGIKCKLDKNKMKIYNFEFSYARNTCLNIT